MFYVDGVLMLTFGPMDRHTAAQNSHTAFRFAVDGLLAAGARMIL